MRFGSLRSTSVALTFLYIPRCCKRVCWEKEFHRQNKFLNQCPIVLVFCNLHKDQQFLFCGDTKQTEVSHTEYQFSFSWRGGIWSSTLSYIYTLDQAKQQFSLMGLEYQFEYLLGILAKGGSLEVFKCSVFYSPPSFKSDTKSCVCICSMTGLYIAEIAPALQTRQD